MFAALRPDGTAVVNADDEFADYWRGLLAGKRMRDFGLDKPAQVSGRHRFTHFGSEIELHAPQGATRIELHADGRHNVLNACAAAACALATGADLEAVARGLAVFRPVGGRMQRRTTLSGAKLIDDSYNANPDSVRAAIEVLAAEPGEKFLLLGDMAEVGERGVEFHEEIGRYARERGIDRLYAAGALARHFATVEALITAAQGELRPQTTMLVKGSRFMRMERVVEALAGEPSSAGRH